MEWIGNYIRIRRRYRRFPRNNTICRYCLVSLVGFGDDSYSSFLGTGETYASDSRLAPPRHLRRNCGAMSRRLHLNTGRRPGNRTIRLLGPEGKRRSGAWKDSGGNWHIQRLSIYTEEGSTRPMGKDRRKERVHSWVAILLFAAPAAGKLIYPGCGGICVVDPVAGATPVSLIPGLMDAVSEIQGSRDDEFGEIVSQDLSPDGQTLAFITFGWSVAGSTDIWTVNIVGTGLKQMVRQERQYPTHDKWGDWEISPPAFFGISWAPDGTEIAYTDSYRLIPPRKGINFLTPGGTPPDSLSNYERAYVHGIPSGGIAGSVGWSLDWSDGRLFFDRPYRGIYSIKRDGEDIQELHHRSCCPAVYGNRVAFATRDSINVMGVDGTDPVYIGPGCCPTWSPDGQRIAYFDDGYLRVMNADGSKQLDISPADYFYEYSTWYSPDLDWIGDTATAIQSATWGQVKASVSTDRSPE